MTNIPAHKQSYAKQAVLDELAFLKSIGRPNLSADFRAPIVMEFHLSPTLADIREQRRITPAAAANYVIAILRAMSQLNSAGLAMQRVKPQDTFIRDGNPVFVDSGSIGPIGSVPDTKNQIFGSPEATISPQGDVYSAGRLFVALIMDGDSLLKTEYRQNIPPAHVLRIGNAEHAVLARATAQDPAERYSCPEEMIRAISKVSWI